MESTDLTNVRILNRHMLNVYWAVWCLAPLVEVIYLYLTRPAEGSPAYLSLLVGLFLNLFFMGTAELLTGLWKLSHPYLIIGLGVLASFVLVHFQVEMSSIYFIFFFPLLVSVFYFRKRYTIVTAAMILTAVMLLYVSNSAFRTYLTQSAFFVFVVMLISVAVLLMLLVDRVKQLMLNLSSALEAKRELMVRNIVMDKMVKTDPLTGLYTHTAFHNYLAELTEQHARMPFHIHLAIIDVDFFKQINDNYGHRAGDLILTEVSDIIRQMIGPDDFAARCGGEEFSILFLEKDMDQVFAVVEKIRARMTLIAHPDIPDLHVTVSIGLNEYRPLMDKDEFYKETDDFMYAAKKLGKNRTVLEHNAGLDKGPSDIPLAPVQLAKR